MTLPLELIFFNLIVKLVIFSIAGLASSYSSSCPLIWLYLFDFVKSSRLLSGSSVVSELRSRSFSTVRSKSSTSS